MLTKRIIPCLDMTEGKVVKELRAGYTLFGQVLRPAQVVVGKGAN